MTSDRMLPGIQSPGGKKGLGPATVGCLIVPGIFIVIFVAIQIITGLSSGDASRDTRNDKYEAIAQCEARIDKLLKSPATAEYDSAASGYGTWTVTGTVDAENSFGAMLRSSYQCTVEIGEDSATTTVDSFE